MKMYPKETIVLNYGITFEAGVAFEAEQMDSGKWRVDVDGTLFALLDNNAVKLERPKLEPGDVYGGGKINPLLIVKAVYPESFQETPKSRIWQAMGIGLSCNSNEFYLKLHTEKEVFNYLSAHKMKFVKNIDKQVEELVKN